jgi:ABC-type spermidine/putrescine transport system permease subunit II
MEARQKPGALFFIIWLVGVFLFLFGPLAVVILMSFNASPYGTLPFVPTMQWYGKLFSEDALFRATLLSMDLSGAVTFTAALFGSLLSVWLNRMPVRWTAPVNAALVSAVTIPWLILGVAMLLVLEAIGLGRSFLSMYLGSLAVTLPYVVFVVVARLQGVDPAISEAARSLGANPANVFVRITVPIVSPAIAAGSLMAFIICFNNFTIQYFLAPFGVRTLPLEIYTLVRVGYRPDINALVTILVGVSVLLVVALQRLSGSASSLVSRRR